MIRKKSNRVVDGGSGIICFFNIVNLSNIDINTNKNIEYKILLQKRK